MLILFVVFLIVVLVFVEEEIRCFDVCIEVECDGDIIVIEMLDVNVEGCNINCGIFWDLLVYYGDED